MVSLEVLVVGGLRNPEAPMPTIAMVLIFVGFVALIVVGAVLAQKAAQARRDALASLAERQGWTFDPDDSSRARGVLERFPPFDQGHSRSAYNTLRGTFATEAFPCEAMAGDYRYRVTSGSGKNRKTRTYTSSYAVFRLPFDSVPDLAVRAEGLMDKLAGAFGFDDIDFESEEFSRKFHVKSPDRRFAYDVMHPRMMEFLLARDAPRIDLVDGYLCMTTGTQTWTPEEFDARLVYARAFFELWPRHLVQELTPAENSRDSQ